MKRMRCPECGHYRTSHYEPMMMSSRDVVCRAVNQKGERICKCARTRDEVRNASSNG